MKEKNLGLDFTVTGLFHKNWFTESTFHAETDFIR